MPVKICSRCNGLSLTEKQQQYDFELSGLKKTHICTIYHQRLHHYPGSVEFMKANKCVVDEAKESDEVTVAFREYTNNRISITYHKKIDECVRLGFKCNQCENKKYKHIKQCEEYVQKKG